jgi:hypothetical protein
LYALDLRMARNGENALTHHCGRGFTGSVIGLIPAVAYFSCRVAGWERAGMSRQLRQLSALTTRILKSYVVKCSCDHVPVSQLGDN